MTGKWGRRSAGTTAVIGAAAMAAAAAVTLGVAPGFAGRAYAATASEGCADRQFAEMTTAERVGQLFVAGVSSTAPSAAELSTIHNYHLGGVVLMGHSTAGLQATRRVSDAVQAHASANGVRLWVAVDQEGGNVQVLRGPGFSEIPTALSQGTLSPATLQSRAHAWGTQLRAAGVNLDLAPVMDTVPAALGTQNKPIGYYDREYGHTPSAVQSHAMAFFQGMTAAGLQTTAKHFPGLGRVRYNTDTTYGVTDTVTTRHDAYLQPFAAAAHAGIPVIMVSNARYAKIDDTRLAPFSPVVVTGMLRQDLGYQGVIMSDSLNATALEKVPVGDRAVRFIAAGGTVALTTQTAQIPTMVHAVLQEAAADPQFRAQVDAAALTVLRTKHRAGLLPCAVVAVRTPAGGIAVHVSGQGGWRQFGGRFFGAPAVLSTDGHTYFFGIGAGHAVYARTFTLPWRRITPAGTYCGGVAAAASGGRIVIACNAANQTLLAARATFSGGLPVVTNWRHLGGHLSSSPAVAVVDGVVTYVAAGTVSGVDGLAHVFRRTDTQPWRPTPFYCARQPTLATGGGATWLGCKGQGGHLVAARARADGTFPAPRGWGGELIGPPGIAISPGGVAYAYTAGAGWAIYDRPLNSVSWSRLGGQSTFGAAATFMD